MAAKGRYNTLMRQPTNPTCKVAVLQFKVPGAKNGGSDKGPDQGPTRNFPFKEAPVFQLETFKIQTYAF